jgi:hypothetical protein
MKCHFCKRRSLPRRSQPPLQARALLQFFWVFRAPRSSLRKLPYSHCCAHHGGSATFGEGGKEISVLQGEKTDAWEGTKSAPVMKPDPCSKSHMVFEKPGFSWMVSRRPAAHHIAHFNRASWDGLLPGWKDSFVWTMTFPMGNSVISKWLSLGLSYISYGRLGKSLSP